MSCIKLLLSENWYKKNDILILSGNQRLKVVSTPKITIWKKILKFITFGVYKPSIYYKCKLIK